MNTNLIVQVCSVVMYQILDNFEDVMILHQLFFNSSQIFSLFNLSLFYIVHILSLFDLLFWRIVHIISHFEDGGGGGGGGE